MKWNKYTITTTEEAEDIVAAMLIELGVTGVEIQDGVPITEAEFEAMYIDPQPELMPNTSKADNIAGGTAEISFYVRVADCSDDQRDESAEVATAATCEGSAPVVTSSTCDEPTPVVNAPRCDETADCFGTDDSYTIHDRLWSKAELDELLENIDREMRKLSQYCNIGSGTIVKGHSDENDWRDNWKAFCKPLVIGRILAKPEWEEVPEEYSETIAAGDLKLVVINPGNAFGTGSHETTKLALEAIGKYVKEGDRVLDIGAGSGILGISALKLGAKYINSTEIDPACEHVMRDNTELNAVDAECFDINTGNILTDRELANEVIEACPNGYDIAVANILAPVIKELAAGGAADKFVRSGGIFITTGIIESKEKEITEAFNNNPAWNVIETEHMGDWVSVTARRY